MSNDIKNQDRNLEGIMHHLRDYLSLRTQQSIRVNPGIANVIDDIVWTQLENLRAILQKLRSFGPERIRVADILVGEDEIKRRAMYSHSDQNSILPEIINLEEERRKTMAELPIHDMRTLFRALNPPLENIVQLIQHWLLWDLPDTAEMCHFDEQVLRVAVVRSQELSEDVLHQYRVALHWRPDHAVTVATALNYEMKRLDGVMQRFLTRRGEEYSYMMIIRRDEEPYSASSQEILLLAKHLKALETIEKGTGPLDQNFVDYYSQVLRCPPADVTRERITDFEKRVIAEEKRRLQHFLTDDRFLGKPFDYKKFQAQQIRERYSTEETRCTEFLKAKGEILPDPVEQSAERT